MMCTEHWRAYVKGLTADRKARARSLVTDTGETVDSPATVGAEVDAAIARDAAAKKAKAQRRAAPRRAKVARQDPKVAEAEALIAEVDALPGPEAVKRNGDPDVQAALETVAAPVLVD